MKIYHVLIIVLSIIVVSCGSSKNSATAEQPPPPSPASESNAPATSTGTTSTNSTQPASTQNSESGQQAQKQSAVKYRLIITFISIGEGIDAKAREMMDANISKYESKSGKKIAFEAVPWGREGETDFCFLLNELSPEDQAALARDMRASFQQHPLVQIVEYQESTHKK